MTIEEAIERMKRVWEQLRDKVIKLGMQIRIRRNLPYMRRSY